MSYIPTTYGYISTSNSTTTPLSANTTFTGTSENVVNYSMMTLFIQSDVSGATNGVQIQKSQDGVNWDYNQQYTIPTNLLGGFGDIAPYNIESPYIRVLYTNGNTSQSVFRLQTKFHSSQSITQTQPLQQTVLPNDTGTVTKSVLYGLTKVSNTIQPFTITPSNYLGVDIKGPVSSFGDLRTEVPTPHCQLDFVYGLNSNTSITGVTGSGSMSAVTGLPMISLNSGAASGSSASITSKRYMKYRPGQGGLCRITSIFGTPANGNIQLTGLGDANNGYFFGYSGTSFGIIYRKATVNIFYPQSSWTLDVCDGSNSSNNKSGMKIIPQYGNVFEIDMTYLGYGNILFKTYNPSTSEWFYCHTIQYANANTSPSVINPSLPLFWQTINSTNTTNVQMFPTCGALFSEGLEKLTGSKYGVDNSKSINSIGITNILTLSATTIFKTYTNKAQIRLKSISVCSDANATNFASVSTLQCIKNPTLGGSPSYTNIDVNNSITSYDIAGTTVSGGIVEFNTILGKQDNTLLDVTDLDIILIPGDIMSFAIKTTTTNAQTFGVAVNWGEDL